jgi:hypothetical protein
MIELHVTREQVVAAGLRPEDYIKILEGRLVSVVLEQGLKEGNARHASGDGSEDHIVEPNKAVLYQWANSAQLVLRAD